ncbi:MAG: gamma-glutamyltransferase [Gemmatimonadota bacterium]
MFVTALALAAAFQQTAPADFDILRQARAPAYAADGRIAVAVRGDLWILHPGADGLPGRAEQLTRGPAWDRDPAWTPDGAVVFASDRAGSVDLWRTGTSGEPERMTRAPEPETEPSVAPDDAIVYVRGSGAGADLWLLPPGGAPRQLTAEPGAERAPAFSPDGQRIAYVAERGRSATLHVRPRDGSARPLHTEQNAAAPAWSTDGRLAFSGNDGIRVTDAAGNYLTLASTEAGEPAWSPDGTRLAVADPAPGGGGYNGDPDRQGDRAAGDAFRDDGGNLRFVAAPAPPAPPRVVTLSVTSDRQAANAAAFDRAWHRVAATYFGAAGGPAAPADVTAVAGATRAPADALERWRQLGQRYREDAVEAEDTQAFERVLHRMMAERPPLRRAASGRAAVSSAHPLATAAGLEVLRAGGNVVEAAIAVSFALGVVEPDASGMGGYGQMVLYLEDMERPTAIEFMTRVPAGAAAGAEPGLPDELEGPTLVNVPGTVAGMELAFRRYGSGNVAWADLLAPAIRYAQDGFELDEAFTTTLRREQERYAEWPSSRALFFRDGSPLEPGDTLRNPDLAWTLRQVAEHGGRAFYEGEVARRLVADLAAHGNPISRQDMRRYIARERRPVQTTYRGDYTVFASAPPTTGGALLTGKLNLLERTNAPRSWTGDARSVHALMEAWRLAPSTGGRMADPDLFPVDYSPFESKDTAAARWECFNPERASDGVRPDCAGYPPRDLESDVPAPASGARATRPAHAANAAAPAAEVRGLVAYEEEEDGCEVGIYTWDCPASGTTAFAVADGRGNMVAVTQTLGTWGGNFYVTPGLGFLYNDKARSYSSDPESPNARLAYARVGTVIAPTLLFEGTGRDRRPLAAIGAAGNAWITAAVYALAVGIMDLELGPQAALELPRMLPSGRGAAQIEDGFDPEVLARLEAMGHEFRRISLTGELRMGYGAAVTIDGGRAVAGADPRRSGAAGAVR